MNALKLAAIGMAVLVVSVGAVTATPGVAADDSADNHAPDDPSNESGNATAPMNESADAAGDHGAAVEERGPPTSLPDQVPDFVGDIHDTIRQFLDGAIDDLGTELSDLLGGDQVPATDNASNETTTTTAPA